jgi:hypothetical protein
MKGMSKSLVSILGSGLIGLSLLSGCGDVKSKLTGYSDYKESSTVSSKIGSLEKNFFKSSNSDLLKLDIGQKTSVLVEDSELVLGASIPRDSRESAGEFSVAMIFESSDRERLNRLNYSQSKLYIVSSKPLNNLRYHSFSKNERIGPESLELKDNEKSKELISSVRKNTRFKKDFSCSGLSVYFLDGNDPLARESSFSSSYGSRTFYEGLRKSLQYNFSTSEEGTKIAFIGDFIFDDAGTVSIKAMAEEAIAPPYISDVAGYWVVPSEGECFCLDESKILKSTPRGRERNSFYPIVFGEATYDKRANAIDLTLDGKERLEVLDKEGEFFLRYKSQGQNGKKKVETLKRVSSHEGDAYF